MTATGWRIVYAGSLSWPGRGESARSRRPGPGAAPPAVRRSGPARVRVLADAGAGPAPGRARVRWGTRAADGAGSGWEDRSIDRGKGIPIATRQVALVEEHDLVQIAASSPRYGNPDVRNALRFGTSSMARPTEPSPARYGMNDRAPWKKNRAAPIPRLLRCGTAARRARSRARASPSSSRCSGRCWQWPGRARGTSGCRPGSRTGSGSGSPPGVVRVLRREVVAEREALGDRGRRSEVAPQSRGDAQLTVRIRIGGSHHPGHGPARSRRA